MKAKLLFICVNYYNEQETYNFVLQVLSLTENYSLQVIVVDNSQRKHNHPLLEMLAEDVRVHLVNAEGNLGYFGAAQHALEYYKKRYVNLPEWIIVCNTDIVFVDENVINKLFKLYPKGFNGVIAPAIYSNISQQDQNPMIINRPVNIKMHFIKWVFKYYPTCFIYSSLSTFKGLIKRMLSVGDIDINIRQRKLKQHEIYAPQGSFIIFNRAYFDVGGDFNYEAFLFSEEIFVAETVRNRGLSVMYDSRLVVLHNEHSTTGLITNRKMASFKREASKFVADKYF